MNVQNRKKTENKYIRVDLQLMKKWKFRNALIKEKTAEVSEFDANETVLKKMFHSLFISISLNIGSVFILFEPRSYFQVNLGFINYSLSS